MNIDFYITARNSLACRDRQLLSALQRIAELFAEREAELHKMKMEAVPWRLESLGKLEDSDLYDTVTQHDLDTVKVKP